MPPQRTPVQERFWKYVERPDSWPSLDSTKPCWDWTGTVGKHGYGVLSLPDKSGPTTKTVTAHRLSYEMHCGPIPPGMHVCHHCDNQRCVNPSHFFLGTAKENQADCAAKGRTAWGEKNANAKLTRLIVTEIRGLRASGITQQAVAQRYGIARQTVGDLWNGRRWAQLAPVTGKSD